MSDDWLRIQDIHKQFNGVRALAGFSCSLSQGEILALIGPNGAGKTTFFNVITGFVVPDSGRATFRGIDLLGRPPDRITAAGVSRTFQKLRLIRHISVLDNVLLAFRNQPGEKIGSLFLRPRASKGVESSNQKNAISLLTGVGLGHQLSEAAGNLSYGEQKLLSLVCCLATDADLLLLDEPVAGINPEMIEKVLSIVRELPAQGKSVILIEHNIDAVMETCDRVIFMDSGRIVSEGPPEKVRSDARVIEAYLD